MQKVRCYFLLNFNRLYVLNFKFSRRLNIHFFNIPSRYLFTIDYLILID